MACKRVSRLTALLLLLLLVPPVRGEETESNLQALFANLRSESEEERTRARDTLIPHLLFELPREASIRPEDRPSIEDVRSALSSDDPAVRVLGAAMAARFGVDAKPVFADLASRLRDPSWPLRYWICESLRRLGPDAAEAAPELSTLLHDHADWGFRVTEAWSPESPGQEAGHLILAALLAIGPDALATYDASMKSGRFIRPGAKGALAILRMHFGSSPAPPEPMAPPAGEPMPTPAQWLVQLEADADAKQVDAFEDLHHHGKAGVPALMHGVEHGGLFVREVCLEILAALEHDAREAAPVVFGLLTSDDPEIRRLAATALAASGAGEVEWVPTILPLVDDGDERVQRAAVRTLGAIGPAAAVARHRLLQVVVQPAGKQDPSAIGLGGPAGTRLRAAATEALGRIGGPPDTLVPALLQAAVQGGMWSSGGIPHVWRGPSWRRPRGTSVHVREVAVRAIGALGLPALPAVRRALVSDDVPTRAAAAFALSVFPVEAVGRSAIRASEDSEASVRQESLRALSRSADEPMLRALARLVSDPADGVRHGAIGVLERLGPAAEAAAPFLVPPLTEGPPPTAYACLKALSAIQPDPETLYAPALATALGGKHVPVGKVLWRLGKLGNRAHGVIEHIAGTLPSLDVKDRLTVLDALGKIDSKHEAYVACLRLLTKAPTPKVRQEAAWRIGLAGLAGPILVPSLARLLDDPEVSVATTAARVLADAAKEHELAGKILAPRIKDKRESVRAHAARGLVAAGQGGKAVKVCLELLESEDEKLRELAVVAITEIGDVASALRPLQQLRAREKSFNITFRILPAIASTGAEGAEIALGEFRSAGSDQRKRMLARQALVHGGEHIVPELRRWLISHDLGTYYAGAAMLGEIGEPARVAIPDLLALARTGRQQALLAATETLFDLGVEDDVLLPHIADCLAADPTTRSMAASLLRQVGPRFQSILPAVERVFQYEKYLGLGGMLTPLGEMGESAVRAVAPLMAALPGARASDRWVILDCLGRLAAHTPAPKPALTWALEDASALNRLVAATALLDHFAQDADVVARVARLLGDPDASVRENVAATLEYVGEAAVPALPDLLIAAEDGDRELMESAMRILSGLKTVDTVVRPVLLRLTESDDAWRACAALAALGRLGGDAAALKALFDEADQRWDWRVRLGAKEGRAALLAAD